MNLTRKLESESMFNAYAYSIGANHLLSEAEQAVEDTKQKVSQAAQSPEGQQAMTKIMQQMQELLQTKFKAQFEQAQQQDGGKVGPAVEALLKQIQDEINANLKKQQANESYNLKEGFLDRQINKVKGMYQKGKDVMSGNVTNKSWKDEAILKRFDSLKQSLSKELAELKADLDTTSNTDKTVKDAVNKAITEITATHGISSDMKGFQKFRHGAGKLVQLGGIAAVLGAPVAALAAPVAAAVGLTGVAATALTGGLTGGAVSMLKDLLNGQKPDPKKAAVTAVTSAAAAGLFSAITDGFAGHDVSGPQDTLSQDIDPLEAGHNNMTADDYQHHADTADIDNMTADDYVTDQSYTNQDFEITQGSALDPNSSLDDIKKQSLEVLRSKGVMGSSQGQSIPSPAVQNVIDGIAKNPEYRHIAVDLVNKIAQLSPEQAQDLFSIAVRRGGDKAVKRALASLLD